MERSHIPSLIRYFHKELANTVIKSRFAASGSCCTVKLEVEHLNWLAEYPNFMCLSNLNIFNETSRKLVYPNKNLLFLC